MQGYTLAYPVNPFVGSYQGMEKGQGGMAEDLGGWRTAQCVVCKVYFSAQPNNLKLIFNFEKYYPIEHIFVPACSSARKEHFFKF